MDEGIFVNRGSAHGFEIGDCCRDEVAVESDYEAAERRGGGGTE